MATKKPDGIVRFPPFVSYQGRTSMTAQEVVETLRLAEMPR